MTFCDNQYSPSPDNQPFHSCKSYAIIDCQNSKILFSKQADEVREMASLTKMMTTYIVLSLVDEFRINMKNTFFPVSKQAANIIGTSANLVEGQVVSIYDLLRGLMLPSGNDAAMVLAENFGHRIMFTKRPGEVRKPSICYKLPG
jgi:D-alanyl-D-alanine carboxypeptidase